MAAAAVAPPVAAGAALDAPLALDLEEALLNLDRSMSSVSVCLSAALPDKDSGIGVIRLWATTSVSESTARVEDTTWECLFRASW